jgi:acetyl-CoA carboxylase biotin carboxyl carrier protein
MSKLEVDDDAIRRLAALIDETGLTEIEYDDGTHRIRVARGAPMVAMAPASTPAVTVNVPAPNGGGQAAEVSHPGAIAAPMVGTVYLQPDPNAPPFVRVGDQVRQGDILLIIEAMKVMNQIPAPRAGTVRQVLVSNGAPVEYGEVMMIIE